MNIAFIFNKLIHRLYISIIGLNIEQAGRLMKHCLATVFLALLATTANAALIDITYDVNRTIGGGAGTVTGSITIKYDDAGPAEQTLTDFANWSLTLTAVGLNGGPTDNFDKNSSTLILNGNGVTATVSDLFYDFSLVDGQLLFLTQSRNFWCLETSNCSSGPDLSEQIGYLDSFNKSQVLALDQYIATDKISFATVSAIPVPAAVWLFVSGLLGLLGLARIRR